MSHIFAPHLRATSSRHIFAPHLRAVVVATIVILLTQGLALGRDPGGGGGSGPYWRVTVTPSGSVSGNFGGSGFSFAWGTYNANMMASGPWNIPTGQTASLNSSGSYSIKVDWVNSDGTPAVNPAKSVIMKTSATSSWHGPAGKSSGSASNGLGNPEIKTATSGASDGVKWQVFDGSSGTFSYKISMSSAVSVNGPASEYTWGVGNSVTATPYPVTVYLVQSIRQNGIENALIGQGITGNLNTYPFYANAQSGHSWSVGGDTFQSWSMTADQAKTTLVTGPGPLNQPTFHCYWKDETTTTISCTATVQSPSGPLSVTGEQKLQVWIPYYYYGYNAGSVSTSPTSVFTTGPGMVFKGAVGTPALFRPIGTGTWTFGQLTIYLYQNWTALNPFPQTLTNGSTFQLDNVWPYPSSPQYFPADSVAPTPPQTGPNPTYLHNTNDNPAYYFDNLARYAIGKGQWEMYMMYQPPGFDVQWVPLAKLYWQWDFDMSWSGSSWTPTPPGSVTAPSGVIRTTIHPMWNAKDVNTYP